MQLIEKQIENYTTISMIIDYRFRGFDNIVCSGKKIYQLPCTINNRSIPLREVKQIEHLGALKYLIRSKRINAKVLKANSVKVDELFEIDKIISTPF
jgi:hypothetical protein